MFEIAGVLLSGIGVLNNLLSTHKDLTSWSEECAGSAGTGERALRVSVDAALRAGIFKASGSIDPMGLWDERER